MKTVVLLCSVSGAISGTAERAPPAAPGSNCNSSTKTKQSCEQAGTLFSNKGNNIICLALTCRDKVDASERIWQMRAWITTRTLWIPPGMVA